MNQTRLSHASLIKQGNFLLKEKDSQRKRGKINEANIYKHEDKKIAQLFSLT